MIESVLISACINAVQPGRQIYVAVDPTSAPIVGATPEMNATYRCTSQLNAIRTIRTWCTERQLKPTFNTTS